MTQVSMWALYFIMQLNTYQFVYSTFGLKRNQAEFKGELTGWVAPGGLQKIEIESSYYINTFASLKSREACLYF
jgi:hypothetical protein